jgi:hypothetical protein
MKRAPATREVGICQTCLRVVIEGDAYRRKINGRWQVRHLTCEWTTNEPNQADSRKILKPKHYYEPLTRYNRNMIK